METRFVEKARELPLFADCDVLVVGGGTAGIVAALAAARTGARTIVVERSAYLGGTLINGAVILHSFFNMYKTVEGAPKVQVVRGIAQEIVDRMVAAGGSLGHAEQEVGASLYDPFITCIDHEIFKQLAFEMMEEAGVELFMHTVMADVILDETSRLIRGVVVETKSGRGVIRANIVIDTSGDADVAARAGAHCYDLHRDMGASMTFGLANIEPSKTLEFVRQYEGMLFQLARVERGEGHDDIARLCFQVDKCPAFRDFIRENPGLNRPKMVCVYEKDATYVNVTGVAVDSLDVRDATRAEIVLRRQIATIVDFFRKNIPGFAGCHVSWTADGICVRKSRIVECEYDLSPEEIENCARFEDEVALFGYHDSTPRILIKNAGFYGIPYRALLPRELDNLLVAGRLITTNYQAHNSTRNTVSCMAQGQAVGTAAAMCAAQGIATRALDVQRLRQKLRADGVYLGD